MYTTSRAGSPTPISAELSERIAAAAGATGIGLTLLPVAYMQGGVDGRALAGGQLRFGNDFDRYAKLAGQAAGSGQSCQRRCGFRRRAAFDPRRQRKRSEGAGTAFSRHAVPHSYCRADPRRSKKCRRLTDKRSMTWLLDHLPVGERWCLIHSTHMTQQETRRVAQSGAVVGLCPITEANLGDGIFDGVNYLAAGGRFGADRTPTSAFRHRRSCASLNTASVCVTSPALRCPSSANPAAAHSTIRRSPAVRGSRPRRGQSRARQMGRHDRARCSKPCAAGAERRPAARRLGLRGRPPRGQRCLVSRTACGA